VTMDQDQLDRVQRALEATPNGDVVDARQSLAQTYATTPEDLWDAATTPERLARWFAPVTGDLREGGSYAVEGNASGTIERCDPPRAFRVSWEFAGAVSHVTVEVAPDGDGARLTLTHEGAIPADLWAQFGPGATGVGWDGSLMALGRYVATGEPAPHPELTDEARAFIAASAERWAAADIAAGTPEDQARAAAERTRLFFTGEGPGVAG
jgi:uncharacterized protein YndB with AHSA1/START domain